MAQRDPFAWLRKNWVWIAFVLTTVGSGWVAYNNLENKTIAMEAAYTGLTQQVSIFVQQLRDLQQRQNP